MTHAHTASVVATDIADPLTAERLVEVLSEAGYESFARPRGAGSSDGIAAAEPASWDIVVMADGAEVEKARVLVQDELAAIDRDGAENAQRAEEEMLSAEHSVPESEAESR